MSCIHNDLVFYVKRIELSFNAWIDTQSINEWFFWFFEKDFLKNTTSEWRLLSQRNCSKRVKGLGYSGKVKMLAISKWETEKWRTSDWRKILYNFYNYNMNK